MFKFMSIFSSTECLGVAAVCHDILLIFSFSIFNSKVRAVHWILNFKLQFYMSIPDDSTTRNPFLDENIVCGQTSIYFQNK